MLLYYFERIDGVIERTGFEGSECILKIISAIFLFYKCDTNLQERVKNGLLFKRKTLEIEVTDYIIDKELWRFRDERSGNVP